MRKLSNSGRAFSEAVFPALQPRELFFLFRDYLLLIPLEAVSKLVGEFDNLI